jgi:tRNA A37 threonylcarbamoyltransferase TsaD
MAPGSYVTHGTTLDDSLGEALDKLARLLGVSGGGAGLERLVDRFAGDPLEQQQQQHYRMPVPMTQGGRHLLPNFSFSGLKSHAARTVARLSQARLSEARAEPTLAGANVNEQGNHNLLLQKQQQHRLPNPQNPQIAAMPSAEPRSDLDAGDGHTGPLPLDVTAALARAFQTAAFAHIAAKTRIALAAHTALTQSKSDTTSHSNTNTNSNSNSNSNATRLVICGGVAANRTLQRALEAALAGSECTITAPDPGFCTDNAAMIAWAAMERMAGAGVAAAQPFGVPAADLAAVKTRPRWPLETLEPDSPRQQ